MMPHMIYSPKKRFIFESLLWGTEAHSPSGVQTSGITQPPVLATAVERVARALPPAEAKVFIGDMLPTLVSYHEWIYRERDPHGSGLASCFHSWESGMDDTPYWTEAMKSLPKPPVALRLIREYRPRRSNQRANPLEVQQGIMQAQLLRYLFYDSHQVMLHSSVVVQDLVFNCVLAAANESLTRLAEVAGKPVQAALHQRFAHTRRAIEQLWDPHTGQYYSKNYLSGELIKTPTIATFMPLYAGTASPARAEFLRDLLTNNGGYNAPFPLPSVPTTSRLFQPARYWRGPVWINMNWFIVTGLERYGFTEEAEWLRTHTLGLTNMSGFREYYQPLTGDGLGAKGFSWSAALTLDLLATSPALSHHE